MYTLIIPLYTFYLHIMYAWYDVCIYIYIHVCYDICLYLPTSRWHRRACTYKTGIVCDKHIKQHWYMSVNSSLWGLTPWNIQIETTSPNRIGVQHLNVYLAIGFCTVYAMKLLVPTIQFITVLRNLQIHISHEIEIYIDFVCPAEIH